MRSTRRSKALLALSAWALLGAPSLAAQSVGLGRISGSVTNSADGTPLVRALVTLTSVGAASGLETTTSESGGFTFELVAPGTYEVRVEALGFRPLLARPLSVSGGGSRSLLLELTPSPPPVLSVDTLELGAQSAVRWSAGAVHFSGDDLDAWPFRLGDLASAAALAPSQDAFLGSQGLPGSASLVVADGVPFYRAGHPLLSGEHLPDALFPRSALSALTVFEDAPDVEWAGSAGGYVTLATRTATRGLGPELEGAWSGDALWSSPELDIETPSLSSFQGGARTTVTISPGISSVVVAAEALRHETPLAPRLSEAAGAALTGLDAELLTSLTEPSTERLSRYSGLVRFDAQRSATSHVFLRGAAGYAQREFDGPGPVRLVYAAGLPEETVDYSFAGGIVSQHSPRLGLELRAGVSGSSRTFESATPDVAGARLVGSPSTLGTLAGGPAESSRADVVLLPLLRYSVGAGVVKLGGLARASRFTMSHSPFGAGELLFSDGAALAAGQGFGRASAAPEASFTTREFGGFLQYDFRPAPGLQVAVGGRLDWEFVPSSEAALNEAWLQASGLRNDEHPSSFPQLGVRAALTWDATGDGLTSLLATLTLQSGDVDPGVLYQLYSRDTEATSTRFAGAGLDWPAGTLPGGAAALPALTLLGPDARPPRSARLSAGVVRRLGSGLSLFVGGAARRTDFLMRRRDLNLPALPVASDPWGRDVFGTLAQDGSLVTATEADGRRFPAFAEVWALDPDGWSEHKALTVGLERRGGALDLYGSYTRSVTEDNWVGAAGGTPGVALSPLLPASDAWTEGRSDFDVPHRAAGAAVLRVGGSSLAAVYRFRSGLPFTPRYRTGVDANGDGSVENDVAVVPDAGQLGELESSWSCLESQRGGFARRNSCRGPEEHALDLRIRIGLGAVGGRAVSLLLDGFNLAEGVGGVIDDALLLVDPAGTLTTSPDGSRVTIPVTVNPDFGQVLYPSTRGRMLRVGLRIG